MVVTHDRQGTPAYNTSLAKVAVRCSADTFVVNQSLVLRINICGKIATFARPENDVDNHYPPFLPLVIRFCLQNQKAEACCIFTHILHILVSFHIFVTF
jgi:hypothetical protein